MSTNLVATTLAVVGRSLADDMQVMDHNFVQANDTRSYVINTIATAFRNTFADPTEIDLNDKDTVLNLATSANLLNKLVTDQHTQAMKQVAVKLKEQENKTNENATEGILNYLRMRRSGEAIPGNIKIDTSSTDDIEVVYLGEPISDTELLTDAYKFEV